ncbi:alkaline phosphatase family protein [soil metagenome]
MKPVLKFVSRFILFWLTVFLINRIVFLFSAVSFSEEASFFETLRSVVSGWALDISTIGYLLPVPAALYTLYIIFPGRRINNIGNIIVSIFIVLYCLICFGELFLYREWTTKLTMQALMHFEHPSEVFLTATPGVTAMFFFLTIIFSTGYIVFYIKRISGKSRENKEHLKPAQKLAVSLLSIVVFVPVNFLMIRGGWRAIPISDSDAYYSSSRVLNDAAVNPLWNLAHNVLEFTTHQDVNPYVYMNDDEAAEGLKKMFAVEEDSTAYFLNTEKPNIVFVILEGFTAYALPNFGGDNFAPFLDSISHQGISFTRCYAAAYASDQGIPAILSAYPSTPKISITNQSSKTIKIPSISRDLKTIGYQSGFIFGGQLNYGNIESYLYNTGFDVVLGRDDFPGETPEGHLGIQDRDMAPLAVLELNKAKQPFMYAWFTISTHSPYDIPVPMKKITESRENEYMNTIVYADEAMRDFFMLAKKQSWYRNTLFVMVSDHSHLCQRNFGIEDKEYHRIVSFFYGDVIKPEFRGKKIEKITSQLDLTPTLLKQFHLHTDQYRFGKDCMNPYTPSFAYYDYHYGSGFITDSCFISRKQNDKKLFINTCSDSTRTGMLQMQHEIYLQEAFQDYLSR